jgi:hypothetical protein
MGQAGHVAETLNVMALGEELGFGDKPFKRGDAREQHLEGTLPQTPCIGVEFEIFQGWEFEDGE